MQNSRLHPGRKQRRLRGLLTAISAACIWLSHAAATAPPPHIVFVTGDHEYSSELTMPALAKELEQKYGMRTTVLYSHPDHNGEKNIPRLQVLSTADLAVFYLRWRQLPAAQLRSIEEYLKSGKPVIAFRTSTHAFKYPRGDALERWNRFGEEVLGAPWITHNGHRSSTEVSVIPAAARHPILTGVDRTFHVRSWLYHILPDFPPKEATRLLVGKAINSERAEHPDNPVAWTWKTPSNGRVFTTTMGHPEDFQVEAFQRLILNAIYWALDRPVPERWAGKMSIQVSYGMHRMP